MLTCDRVSVSNLVQSDLELWRAMQAATPAFRSPLLSPEFVRAVTAVRSDTEVAVFKRRGRTVGFLPFHPRPGRFARPAGAPFADYSALLTLPEPHLKAREVLHLAGIDQYQAIGLVDPYNVFGKVEGEEDEAFAIDLTTGGPANNANKKLEKNIRRLRRHLEDAHGEVRFVMGDRDPEHFELMLRLKREQTRLTGLHDFLAPGWVQQLLRNMFDAPKDQLHGNLITLMAGDAPLLFHFGARMGDRGHPWISTYDPAYATFSPGQIFLGGCAEHLAADGISYYDLSTGAQAYKAVFSNTRSPVRHARIYSDRARWAEKLSRFSVTARRVMGVDGPIARLNRRVDQIACLELDTLSRARGIAFAFSNATKRMKATENA